MAQRTFSALAIGGMASLAFAGACSSASRATRGGPEAGPGPESSVDPSGDGGVVVTDDDASPIDTTCAATATQAKHAEVDFVVVIDTSGSMDTETAQVRANIND